MAGARSYTALRGGCVVNTLCTLQDVASLSRALQDAQRKLELLSRQDNIVDELSTKMREQDRLVDQLQMLVLNQQQEQVRVGGGDGPSAALTHACMPAHTQQTDACHAHIWVPPVAGVLPHGEFLAGARPGGEAPSNVDLVMFLCQPVTSP